MHASRQVLLSEEGPREGFQSEPVGISTQSKVELIEALAETGLAEIACCSFVNQAQVPQMADAEHLVAQLRRKAGVRYTGLRRKFSGCATTSATARNCCRGSGNWRRRTGVQA